jgi:hypothetical protein
MHTSLPVHLWPNFSVERMAAGDPCLQVKGFTHSLVHVKHLRDWLDHRIQATPKSAGTGNTVTAIPTSLTIAEVVGGSGEGTAERRRRPGFALARNGRIMASSASGALPPAYGQLSQFPCHKRPVEAAGEAVPQF